MKPKNDHKIKEILANILGIEIDDIHDDFLLVDDLHMSPNDLTDLIEAFSNLGHETKDLDFDKIDSVEKLIDHYSLDEF